MSFLKYIPALPAVHIPAKLSAIEIKAKAAMMKIVKEQAKLDDLTEKAKAAARKAKFINSVISGNLVAELSYVTFKQVSKPSNSIINLGSLTSNLSNSLSSVLSSGIGFINLNSGLSNELAKIKNTTSDLTNLIKLSQPYSAADISKLSSSLVTISNSTIGSSLGNVPGLNPGSLQNLTNSLSSFNSLSKIFGDISSKIKNIKASPQYNRQDLISVLSLPKLPKIPKLPRLF